MFPIAPSLVMVGRLVTLKKEYTLEGVRENAGLPSKKAWLRSQLEDVVFSFVISYLFQENIQFVLQFTFAH